MKKLDETIKRFSQNAEYERTHGNLQDCMEFKQLAEWLKELKKFREQQPYEKFESAKDHIYKLAGDYKCWDNRLTEDEAVELCHILEQEPCYNPDEWCKTCKEYDHDKHCCSRYNKVIRNAVEEMKQEAYEDAIAVREFGLNDFIEFGKKAFGVELTFKKSDNPDTYEKLFGTIKNDLEVDCISKKQLNKKIESEETDADSN